MENLAIRFLLLLTRIVSDIFLSLNYLKLYIKRELPEPSFNERHAVITTLLFPIHRTVESSSILVIKWLTTSLKLTN